MVAKRAGLRPIEGHSGSAFTVVTDVRQSVATSGYDS